jgi:glycosyltransferase involved in cell wall biosynthesis
MEGVLLKPINQKRPLVSIIIDNYNYGQFLRRAIDSALNQTYPNIEVIVVDDGSTDNSREIIADYGDRVIPVLKKNGGQASSLNEGFNASHSAIICFLDSDDYFPADKVIRIVRHFEMNPSIGWIFHQLEYVDRYGNRLSLVEDSDFLEITLIDLRESLVCGQKLPLFPTTTSALCFRHVILEQLLPIPKEIKITSDNFLKIAALTLSPGLYSPERLAFLCIHGSNAYSFRKDAHYLRAEISIKTAYYLREIFCRISRYTDRIFASSFGSLIAQVGFKKTFEIPECYQYKKRYIGYKKWFTLGPRIVFNCLKAKWVKLVK